jgi:hypothetical protein
MADSNEKVQPTEPSMAEKNALIDELHVKIQDMLKDITDTANVAVKHIWNKTKTQRDALFATHLHNHCTLRLLEMTKEEYKLPKVEKAISVLQDNSALCQTQCTRMIALHEMFIPDVKEQIKQEHTIIKTCMADMLRLLAAELDATDSLL